MSKAAPRVAKHENENVCGHCKRGNLRAGNSAPSQRARGAVLEVPRSQIEITSLPQVIQTPGEYDDEEGGSSFARAPRRAQAVTPTHEAGRFSVVLGHSTELDAIGISELLRDLMKAGMRAAGQ